MKKLYWKPRAELKFFEYLEYLSTENIEKAKEWYFEVKNHLELVQEFPYIGKEYLKFGCCQFYLHPAYFFYEVHNKEIVIIDFYHYAQKR